MPCMAIPSEIKRAWLRVYGEVISVHADWAVFLQLYGHSPERIKLLNEVAWHFFGVVQMTLLGNIQLTLAKLNDRPRIAGNETLTLNTLMNELKELKPSLDAMFLARAQSLLSTYSEKCGNIIKLRNRWLAHLDYRTVLNIHPELLKGTTHQEIEEILGALRAFMHHIESRFEDHETAFDHYVSVSDGESLICILKRGLRYQQLEYEQKLDWNDLMQSPWHSA